MYVDGGGHYTIILPSFKPKTANLLLKKYNFIFRNFTQSIGRVSLRLLMSFYMGYSNQLTEPTHGML
jgi:predicted NAD/FAD-dependent oxidoreductase